jgi:hypothetical protein
MYSSLRVLLLGFAMLTVAERGGLACAEGGDGAAAGSGAVSSDAGVAGSDPGVSAGSAASTPPAAKGGPAGRVRGFLDRGGDPERRRATDARHDELHSEQGLARDAVSRGLVRPLESILREVEAAAPGSVLSVRLKKDERGVWIYSLVILSADGRYRNVVVDAARNHILQIE